MPSDGLRILLVDDDRVTNQLFGIMLRGLGHEVVVAADGEDVLRRMEDTYFDLLVTDLEMPGISGADLVHRIRSNDRMSPLPILVVTGNEQDDPACVSLASIPRVRVLSKPITPVHLQAAIAEMDSW